MTNKTFKGRNSKQIMLSNVTELDLKYLIIKKTLNFNQ